MKRITTHHDGHGLTEDIMVVAAGEPGPGGAHHRYEFWSKDDQTGWPVGWLRFQEGPRNDPDSTPGVVTVAVLAALADQLEDFQAGPYPSDHGAMALIHIHSAMACLKARADERAKRGVLGTLNA